MKRFLLFPTLLLAALVLATGLALAQTPPLQPAPGGAPGMVPPGGGRRQMGGPMAGQRGMGGGLIPEQAPAIQALPQEKRDKLHALQVGTREKMMGLNGQMEAKGMALSDAMHAYPIDQVAAKKAEAGLVQIHGQMFEVRLQAMAQAQQIMGKDAWTKLQADMKERGMQRRGKK